MNGETLYEIYRRALEKLCTTTDPWDDLSGADQDEWQEFARLLSVERGLK